MLRASPFTQAATLAAFVALVLSGCTREQPEFTAPGKSLSSLSVIGGHIPGQYIVVLRDDVQDVDLVARTMTMKYSGELLFVYKAALKGFALKVSDEGATALRSEPLVSYVEQDQEVQLTTGQPNTTWGLQRVSQRGPLPQGSSPFDTTYSYTYFADGTDVTVYIIDSGIDIANADFGGRARVGYDALGGNGIDCFGHGTHVSGTVGGNRWGVAKNVQLVAVRVFDCSGGGGTTSRVIAAIDWVTANRVLPAVTNMSLRGPLSTSETQAVENSIKTGYVTYVVSAGNDSANACNYSPQNAPDAIVVAATDIGDHFASFSNFGSCVRINAPGVNVTSDGLNGLPVVMSGTSMAAPHVTGTAALYLSAPNAATSPFQVSSAILTNSSSGYVLGLPTNTPNLIDYSAFIVTSPPTSVTAGGGVDSTAFCGPYGFGGTHTCSPGILGVVASGGNAISMTYMSAPNGQRGSTTLILSGATASGGVDSTAFCGPYGFGGTHTCTPGILGIIASGGNTITVTYMSAPYGNRGSATITLSGATASGGVDSTAFCGPYGFGGTHTCSPGILGVVASGDNTISLPYMSPPNGQRHQASLILQ